MNPTKANDSGMLKLQSNTLMRYSLDEAPCISIAIADSANGTTKKAVRRHQTRIAVGLGTSCAMVKNIKTPTIAVISTCNKVARSTVSAALGNAALSRVSHADVLTAPPVTFDIRDVVSVSCPCP